MPDHPPSMSEELLATSPPTGMRLGLAALRSVLEAHGAWLERRPGGRRASLSGMVLAEAALDKINLERADLKAANHPVQTVDWYDTVKWCNARSQQAGLTPVYYTDAGLTQVYTNGETDAVFVNWTASGFRLPTEAEWEKAARGGLSAQRFPWGNVISESLANYFGDPTNQPGGFNYDLGPFYYNAAFDGGGFSAEPFTSPPGSFAANGYG